MAADAELQVAANVEGTRNAVDLADALEAGCFHHMSSIAVAGLYAGVLRDDMFDEAEDLDHYFGALRLIMEVLPGMAARHRGHIINMNAAFRLFPNSSTSDDMKNARRKVRNPQAS